MRKSLKYILLTVILVVMLGTNCFAKVYVKDWAEGNTYYSARCESFFVASKIAPFYETQTQHTKGYITTIGITSAKTKTDTQSSSVSAGFNGFFVECHLDLGLSSSVSRSVSVNQSFTIPATSSTGLYRIEAVFPRLKTTNVVNALTYLSNPVFDEESAIEPNAVVYNHTVLHKPIARDAYIRINRYADVS